MNRNKYFISLKAKIIISTIIPLALSLIIISSILFFSMFDSRNHAAKTELLQIIHKYAYQFENKINNAMNYLVILASELEGQINAGIIDREKLQENIMAVFDDYKLLDGSSVYFEPNMYDNKDAFYINTNFGTLKSGRIGWYFFTDNGKTAYIPESLEDDVEFELPHYTMAKEKNRPIFTDPVTHIIEGKSIPMFTLTHPVRNPEGDFIGAITVDLFLDEIHSQLRNEKIYTTGYVIVHNENERVIYSSNYEDIGKVLKDTGLSIPVTSGNESTVFFNTKSTINGKDSLGVIESVYVPLLDSSFYISITAPFGEINAEGIRLSIYLIILILLVVAATICLLSFLIGKISAPLKEITENIDKIANGEYGSRIKGSYKGEFAVVKDSVNTMAHRIEVYMEESKNSLEIMTNIFDGLDAFVYVTVPDTGEILFVNERMKENHSINDNIVGQFCYKLLRDDTGKRCDFCPCYQLDNDPNKAVVWEEYRTRTKRYYHNTDRYIKWIDGRNVHLQHSVDITDIKNTQIKLDRRLDQQSLMVAISQSFLSGEKIEKLIANALQMTGEFMDIAQILYYKLEGDEITFTCLNEWINKETGQQSRVGSKKQVSNYLLNCMRNMATGDKHYLDVNDPTVGGDMEKWKMNFKNYILVPIFLKGKLYGALDFFREDGNGEWGESNTSLATMVSSLLSGVSERHILGSQIVRLSAIVESSPQFISIVSNDGNFEYFNSALLAMSGYSKEELSSGGLRLIFGEENMSYLREKVLPAVYKNGKFNYELPMMQKCGAKRIISVSVFVIDNNAKGSGSIATDVTDMRRLENDLIQAKDLAEQGSRTKSEFLSRMSHEMRTPMNAIIGMTNIAKSSTELERKNYCLEKIESASNHLLGVINDVLDMAKIEAGKFELSITDFNLEKMLIKITNVINYRMEEKKLNFTIKIDWDVPQSIVSDEQRLNQVITNLLSNAVKFTPPDGTITLFIHKVAENDGLFTLEFGIRDSGIGISEEQQERLFHSFEQADGSVSRKYGGTGLGLAISKNIVELMNGKIWVESAIGEGSSFIFQIQVKKGHSVSQNLLGANVNWNNLRILAVDDEEDVLKYFLSMAEALNLQCEVAANGTDACELIEKNDPYNIIFVDWKMPDMNGIELTKRIKGVCNNNTVIIMISAIEWSYIEIEAKQAGVDRFISKPLFTSAIVDCINECLGLREKTKNDGSTEQDIDGCFAGKRILLAEDVEINREIVIALLEPTGLQIDCAENGQIAYKMFETFPDYDAIFMDIHMPEVDGYESARMIRALPDVRAKNVPIIAMTANVFREDIEKCLQAGMNVHIGKPLNIEEVMAKLKQYLLP